jgi:quercetin dioxygenase-like cupin family protein
MPYHLRLFADRLAAGEALELGAGPVRALYVRDGGATIVSGGSVAALAPNSAWQGAGALALTGGAGGAQILRFELVAAAPDHGAPIIVSPPLALDPRGQYLLRCDRVEFPPGGVAYRHTHQGPGLRCLVAGAIRIDAGGASHAHRPGEAWFENGVDPVFAAGSDTDTTAFIRVMVLPRALVGKSSIRYVDEADKDKPRLQRYQIYLDHPIELPGSRT